MRLDQLSLDRMMAAMAHRGPDDTGRFVDAAAGVAVGHNRLSIIDLSPGGHQPMVNPGNGDVLTFNGEIYNFRELRRELEAKGYRFRSQSDTEVLLHAFAAWGAECVQPYPRHVRIRDLAPGRARSVSISGSDGDQAALLLEAAGRRNCVRVGT